jgi:hypothetical protein
LDRWPSKPFGEIMKAYIFKDGNKHSAYRIDWDMVYVDCYNDETRVATFAVTFEIKRNITTLRVGDTGNKDLKYTRELIENLLKAESFMKLNKEQFKAEVLKITAQ